MFKLLYLHHKILLLHLYFLTYEDMLFFKRGLLKSQARQFYCTTVYTDSHHIYTKALVSHANIQEKQAAAAAAAALRVTYQTS